MGACPCSAYATCGAPRSTTATLLGFHLDRETGVYAGIVPGEGAVNAILERGGCEIHLQIRRGELPARERQTIETDVYVRVADVDALYAELAGRGARLRGKPSVQPYGMKEIGVDDAFGFTLSFGSPS